MLSTTLTSPPPPAPPPASSGSAAAKDGGGGEDFGLISASFLEEEEEDLSPPDQEDEDELVMSDTASDFFKEYTKAYHVQDLIGGGGGGDPCHEYEHSVLFFLILTSCALLVALYCYLLFKRWKNTHTLRFNQNIILNAIRRLVLAGHDILTLLLFAFAAVRFGPKLWGALQVQLYNNSPHFFNTKVSIF